MSHNRATPLTLLVVDDEPEVRSLARRILEAGNWTVLEAGSGAEALRLIAREPRIGILITDVHMPGMTGVELAAEIRALGRSLPVLYLTGYSHMLFTERQALGEGEAFLAKPFSRIGLLEATHQVLGMHNDALTPEDSTTSTFVVPEWFKGH